MFASQAASQMQTVFNNAFPDSTPVVMDGKSITRGELRDHITLASRSPRDFSRWVNSHVLAMENIESRVAISHRLLEPSDPRNFLLGNMVDELGIARTRLRKYSDEHNVLYSKIADLIYAVQRALSVYNQVSDYIEAL